MYGNIVTHEIRRNSTTSSLLPSTFAKKMEDQSSIPPQQQQPEQQRGYHQLAPLHGQGAASDAKEDVQGIALSAIDAVAPNEMIVKAIQVEDGMLVVQGEF